ncbi:MAG TPA: spore cortex biosynthesis protein YabQ [Lachnospiraceae bacterium]|nr:spore cortex biosynthesis protein YabQ [Lachnospiraceae bacterium]HPF29830.1 spore cortex biosynthesis protein YabQ [Lachnospiraceae bacterium]
MMQDYIRQELWLFAWGAAFGCALAFLYDCFRILRRVFSHSLLWITVEDVIYWLIYGNVSFVFLYWIDDGKIRLCAVLAASLGTLLYELIGPIVVRIASKGLIWACNILKKWKRWLTVAFSKGIIKLCKHFRIGKKKRKQENGPKKEKKMPKKNGI